MVKDRIGLLRPFEYEYRDAEYEYEKTQGRRCASYEMPATYSLNVSSSVCSE